MANLRAWTKVFERPMDVAALKANTELFSASDKPKEVFTDQFTEHNDDPDFEPQHHLPTTTPDPDVQRLRESVLACVLFGIYNCDLLSLPLK